MTLDYAMCCVRSALSTIFFVVIAGTVGCRQSAEAKEPLPVKLDSRGPFVLLVTQQAEKPYSSAIAAACELHPDAQTRLFDPADLTGLKVELQQISPRYAMIFALPQEIDVNFAWKWLALSTQIDEDPFVDVRTGFITAATPADAESFVKRIGLAARGELQLPGKLIDNLGPNLQAARTSFYQSPGSFFLESFQQRLGVETISHGAGAYAENRLEAMGGAGILHLGGHGHPDRVDDGLQGEQIPRLKLSPCVVFNGCCYTGVTNRWFEPWTSTGKVREHQTAAADSFCLNLLKNQTIAYLAALHPDHGIPVYQEMEYMAWSGASLGEVIKYTQDGVVLGAGGKLPGFHDFKSEEASPHWTPSEVMLRGTAARVLFGDPALIVGESFLKPPFQLSMEVQDSKATVTAEVSNSDLKSTFTDTYHADLAWDQNGFNDRAMVTIALPDGWISIAKVQVVAATNGNKPLKHRLVAYGLETDADSRRLHIHVDFSTTGYMQSPFRSGKSRVVFQITRE